jgi:murein DD-endopeptidase MepM/ murein hydrolase activator NlpD
MNKTPVRGQRYPYKGQLPKQKKQVWRLKMSDKNKFSKKMEHFVNGKGFYIVLTACIAVIGISAWVLVFYNADTDVTANEDYVSVSADASDTLSVPEVTEIIIPSVTETTAPTDETTETANPISVPEEVPEEIEETPQPQEAPDEHKEETTENDSATSDLIFIWPVSGELEVDYSPASLIYSRTMADWRTHDGIDIAAQIGTRVMAVAAGTVESVRSDDMLGTVVTIDHGNGLQSVYANLAATPTVKEGDAVTMGSVIGSVGDTALGESGEVTHLHFAMTLNGSPVDPTDYLPNR